jgi:hydroxyacylglutathione hydrolase
MKVTAIPAFWDNYIWALHDDHSAIVVDPGEAAPILAWLAAHHIRLVGILVTHHHSDHIGGIAEILAHHPAPVYASARSANRHTSHLLRGGETVEIEALGVAFEVIATPGHTLDHLCYVGHGALFCGDTIFSCGCGRLFEGTPVQMHASLSRLLSLPDDTLVYCAHEYTLENIDFAMEVEPDNLALRERLLEAEKLRAENRPTLPVSLGQEKATNPLLRFDHPAIAVAATQHYGYPVTPGVAAFAAVRAWRDER